ncbi:hypothetical protein PHYSODRAFT_305049 [Phytophthora sojae]|uniref:Uncharacterized protein n=1 Tax=Phytophthora sojae (strain P6497) TaxID=1094619 RepID=G5A4E8_PHYSP|nr:hypothetical protein PHYSODRAFT_305049 [Phytophthora sojae]EGZ09549.1 hypothetical protein PHYSODRAFT_305049 [Phytophthora sojae]|eukprot:XP_009534410.1 hypothetical protein PHYSODRAFT_305049 [Phytophthora sojae]
MTPAESTQSRQQHSAPGAAPSQSRERDRAQQYKAFLAPRSFYHEPSLPPISPLASPPVRARLTFEDETKIEDARDSTYRQPCSRLADYVAQAHSTSTSRLDFPSPPTAGGIAGKSALGKRSASGTEANTRKRGGRSAENDLEELGFSTPLMCNDVDRQELLAWLQVIRV